MHLFSLYFNIYVRWLVQKIFNGGEVVNARCVVRGARCVIASRDQYHMIFIVSYHKLNNIITDSVSFHIGM